MIFGGGRSGEVPRNRRRRGRRQRRERSSRTSRSRGPRSRHSTERVADRVHRAGGLWPKGTVWPIEAWIRRRARSSRPTTIIAMPTSRSRSGHRARRLSIRLVQGINQAAARSARPTRRPNRRARRDSRAHRRAGDGQAHHGVTSRGGADCGDRALLCGKNAATFLAPAQVETPLGDTWVEYHPIGVVVAVEPWNYPFYQLMRVCAPNMAVGNPVLAKHASIVPQCAVAFEELVTAAGAPKGVWTNIFASGEQVANLIADDRVQGVALTGSENAGSIVAAQAGKHLKKSVMELGGADVFVVLDDADVDKAVELGVEARLRGAGQVCNGAKRFLVHETDRGSLPEEVHGPDRRDQDRRSDGRERRPRAALLGVGARRHRRAGRAGGEGRSHAPLWRSRPSRGRAPSSSRRS